MGTHRIEIDPFDRRSIDRALKMVEKIQKDFSVKLAEFLKEIAELGADAAREEYGGHVRVEARQVGQDEWVIEANHEAIVFFEFGAGAATDSDARYAKEMPFRVERGSYSDENEGMYQATDYRFWMFGGREYTEIKQRPGMQKAYDAIMSQWQEVARRVFG
jgi:hypothetical protein